MLTTVLILSLAQCPADMDHPPFAAGGYTGAGVGIDGDLFVDVNDLLDMISGWGNPYTVDDLLNVIAGWGDCE